MSNSTPPLHQLEEWHSRYGITAGLSSRAGESDDFGLGSSIPSEEIFSRWLSLPHAVGGTFTHMCTGRQVHGTSLRRHAPSSPSGQWTLVDEVDGHLTEAEGVLLTVTIADCVPVYVFARDTKDLGLLHAGWRGVEAGILEKAIAEMSDAGAKPQNIVLHFGPAICGDCYEVGPEVAKRLGEAQIGTKCVDLRAILARKAEKTGVKDVSTSAWCTKHDTAFHSYRRDGSESGRMAAYLGKAKGKAICDL